MTQTGFLRMIVPALLKEGITIKFLQRTSFKGAGGWWDDDKKELMVCVKDVEYFATLVHEYCHYLQWKKERDKWENEYKADLDYFNNWLERKKGANRKRKRATARVQEIELDCDRKVLKLIKKYKLKGIDVKYYCQSVNAYILSYLITEDLRKWPMGYIDDPELVKHFPDKLMPLSYYRDKKNIPKGAREPMMKAYRL